MPKIYDNIETILIDGLESSLKSSKRADFCVGYFYLKGWSHLADFIDKFPLNNNSELPPCRLLVGMHKSPDKEIRDNLRNKDSVITNDVANKFTKLLAKEFKEQITYSNPTNEDETSLRHLRSQLSEGRLKVKLHLDFPLHAKIYLCYLNDRDRIESYLGSSNLTVSGLLQQGELNIDVQENDANDKLVEWFENRWESRWCIDITTALIEVIDNSWASDKLLPPYYIYLKMAYHLSQEARAGLSEYKLTKQFEETLFDYQSSAVRVAAKKLEKRNGVIIGDVVGLGKTMIACAIAKIYEQYDYFSTLVICPPNLEEMWQGYRDRFDLKMETLSHGKVDTELIKKRRFRLVIIDESHNFRNKEGKRYQYLKDYLFENDSKVILLTATPYNMTYIDLANQLKLFLSEDIDLGISPQKYIEEIGGAHHFQAKHNAHIRTINAFEHSKYSEDWQELMKMFLVRRTRSFIKENYANLDEDKQRYYLIMTGGFRVYFPNRKISKVEFKFNTEDSNDQYAALYSTRVVTILERLRLPRYGLSNYLKDKNEDFRKEIKQLFKLDDSTADKYTRIIRKIASQVSSDDEIFNLQESLSENEKRIIANLSRAGKRLIGFTRTNLFKRLESSGYSFLLSLCRHVLRNTLYIHCIDEYGKFPIGNSLENELNDFLEDTDPETFIQNSGSEFYEKDEDFNNSKQKVINFISDYNDYIALAEKQYNKMKNDKNVKWISSKHFKTKLKYHLENDSKKILNVIKSTKNWYCLQDRKLNALENLLSTQHPEDKILVFTQYADTAEYLYRQLKNRNICSIEFATGNSKSPTVLAQRFSPVSNEKPEFKGNDKEIRILITTDVLSEGQNLQDAHIVVNYDLPWAIIRLIQRAGRVDRIGQMSDTILCYSFLPEDGIESIISLRKRLTNRIKENAEVVGSDETFFEGDPVNVADLYNEKAGLLDDVDGDSEVDLSSQALQIWNNAIKQDKNLEKIIPNLSDVVYSAKEYNGLKSTYGAIVYTKTPGDNDVLTWLDNDGNIITQSPSVILKVAECESDTPALSRDEKHHELVSKAVEISSKADMNLAGTLGGKRHIRYIVYNRMEDYYRANSGTLFISEKLKNAIDDIYANPLRETAKEVLNRKIRTGASDYEIADALISLYEENRLVIKSNDEDNETSEPKIICSLGLVIKE